jgi:cell division protein FtsL
VRLQPPRLDRIVRGRAWIPVLGALLVAIVGLRVEVLKLGSGVGSEIQQAATLQSSNSALRAQISALGDNQRIERLAAAYGMHLPDPLDVHFVQASVGRHVQAAIHNISAPSDSTFLTGLAAEQQSSQQSSRAVAAMNGAASTNTSGTTAATSTAGNASTSGVGTVASTGGGSVTSGATTVSAAGQTASGASSVAAGSSTNTGGGTSSTTTAGGAVSTVNGTSGLTTGTGANSTPTGSQSTPTTGSTNGGTGLAG